MSKSKEKAKENKAQDQKPKAKKSLLWRIVKWTLLLLVLVYIILTILSRLGGSTPVLKQAVEDYISDATGRSAKIGKLNHMSFFPDIGLDFMGLTIEDPSGDMLPITVGSTKIAFRFFDVLLGRKSIRTVDVQDVKIPSGALTGYDISIEKIFIEDVEGAAAIKANGLINEKPVFVSVPLEAHGSKYGRYYSVFDEKQITATLAALSLNATAHGKNLKNIELSLGEKKVLTGDFKINRNGAKTDISGAAHILKGGSKLKLDITLDTSELLSLSGEIESERAQIGDFQSQSPFMKTLDEISAVFASKEKKGLDFNGQSADLDIDVKSLRSGAINLGTINAEFKIKDNILSLKPEGSVSNGRLSGHLTLDANKQPAVLDVDLKINKFDYGAFQRQFKAEAEINGLADIGIALKGQGKTGAALQKSLNGTISFVGGKGKLRSSLLDVWGGGLLNALLPNFGEDTSLEMNCAVANFKIKEQVAEADALFVDTRRVTLTGSGIYNIAKDDMDMKLTPKAKDVALGDIASAVNLSGPLSDLSASPNVFDLGKKVGGLLLGAVNPAFLAVTLTDLGLNDDHPCKQFVIEKEELAPPKAEAEIPPEANEESLTETQAAPNE